MNPKPEDPKPEDPKPENRALAPAHWVKFLERAGVGADALTGATTPHAKAIAAGKYLAAKVGRTVPVSVEDRTGKATLRMVKARANQKLYWFEIEWDLKDLAAPASQTPAGPEPRPTAGTRPEPAPASPTAAPTKTGNQEQWE